MADTKTYSENPMGYKPIPKLLFSLAVPAVIANVVNALYNIVDQIFIGQGVGYLGNAATNIAFPITTICMAIGLMTGLGSAAAFNLELGRKNQDKAKKAAGTAVTMLVICGILICILIRSFLEPLMMAFGATDEILEYAMEYAGITSFGIPFLLLSTGINPLVRADGSAAYSMTAVITGAVLNTLLDPLFMFVFDMGIAGAAWATVISQIVSAALLLLYFPRFKSVRFCAEDFIPRIPAVRTIISLGITSFIFQFSTMIIQITTNNLLKIYGEMSVYGSDIPIAVAGIVSKINVIFTAVVLGVVQGSQPICSFNYGAKKYDRVRETVKILLKSTFLLSVIMFAIFELFPSQIISLFGDGDELYFAYATKYMRVFLFFVFLNGIQIAITTFFPSIGKALKGAFLSLSKQIIFLLPLLVILPRFFGVEGIMYAMPVSDFIAFLIAAAFLAAEMKKMPREI
ncbi:MATE efflux family protein [Marvinbryantia formatexigens DSM 14469]|uniref:Multidrug export protein MepA n=1 Tax=Marvinbryantia formatexigens DSM 14469 TaxID=478749 RepID=C6L9G0_9FIRM|nr:MATE family efflux transporter [Marvinbryantia formatexigens]EET62899.1 MATE efflux family protein [Marvinbryantia formatexigens DSM 14469]UWO23495.1 MATE family efflux transporter [Marvinbryantia formatexigens DSM 14469]SDG56452.1 putative efflux protein, MATE family [Marvinbryantia formatexigens]